MHTMTQKRHQSDSADQIQPHKKSCPAEDPKKSTSAAQVFTPHYSRPHALMLSQYSALFEEALGPKYREFLKKDMPQSYDEVEFFDVRLFNNPGLIEKGALPTHGYQGFILASLYQLWKQDQSCSLSFEALFGCIRDKSIGRKIVQITGDPRYLDWTLDHFNNLDLWKKFCKHRPSSYPFLPLELRSDLELAKIVCDVKPNLYQHTAGDSRDNLDLAMNVCKRNGLMLAYCPRHFRERTDLIQVAYENNAQAARFIGAGFATSSKQLKTVKQLKMKHLPEEFLLNDRVLAACSDAGIWDDNALVEEKLQEWKDKLFFVGKMEGKWASPIGRAYKEVLDTTTVVPDVATPATNYKAPRRVNVSALRSSQSPEESTEQEVGRN